MRIATENGQRGVEGLELPEVNEAMYYNSIDGLTRCDQIYDDDLSKFEHALVTRLWYVIAHDRS